MARVYLGLGSNLGDKETNLRAAVYEMEKRVGKLIALSAFYITEPCGFVSDHSFLNGVCCFDTALSPMELLEETQCIERDLGRTQKSVGGIYKDRMIDIDILLYDDLIMNTSRLTIPHPLMCERRFVMEPLVEIAPDEVHPVTGKLLKDYLLT